MIESDVISGFIPATEVGIVILLIVHTLLGAYRLYLEYKKGDQTEKINRLIGRTEYLENRLNEEIANRKKLEVTIFELTKENSRLQGRLEVLEDQQKAKEHLIKASIKT